MLIQCNGCNKKWRLPDDAPGKSFACPECAQSSVIPTNVFLVQCESCNSKLSIKPRRAGQKVKCPKCHNGIQVPILTVGEITAQVSVTAKSPSDSNAGQPTTRNEKIGEESTLANSPKTESPTIGHGEGSNVGGNILAATEVTPVVVPSISPQFLEDLKVICRTVPVAPTADLCIQKLSTHFDRMREETGARQRDFRIDLRRVFNEVALVPEDQHLRTLAMHFEAWRTKARTQMGTYFAELPADDPLCCSISLFGIMKHGRLETAHTQVLAWLLDPKMEHGFGDGFLRALLSHLSGETIVDPIHVEKTHSEYVIDDGRLDVIVQGDFRRASDKQRWLLLIEAKIDANEGEQQLRTYDKWAGKHANGRDVYRVFLTPDGRSSETAIETWTPLTFLQLACIFRTVLKQQQERPGYHFLRFYICGVLKDICKWSLPLTNPETCDDPYNFVEYLKTVSASQEKNS